MKSLLALAILMEAIVVTPSVRSSPISYDPQNRLTNITCNSGFTESFSYSPSGNRLSRVITAPTNSFDLVSPTVPGGLFISTQSTGVSLSWDRSRDTGGAGLAGYRIFLNGQSVANTSTRSFTLSGLIPNTRYCATVEAYDRLANASALSEEICFTTPAAPIVLTALGFDTNRYFHLQLSGGDGSAYQLYSSSNLVDWTFYTSVLPGNPAAFLVISNAPVSRKFFQVR